MSILAYNSKEYEKIYNKNVFLVCVGHFKYNNGSLDAKKVIATIQLLNLKAPQNIKFDASKSVKKLEGGACSALSLRFCDFAIPLLQDESENEIRKKCMQYAEQLESKRNLKDDSFRKKIRSVQAAFNTFAVLNKEDPDVCTQKMQAIANYYGLDVQRVTDELDITANTFNEEIITQQLETLERGVYCIRIIQYPEIPNDKLEVRGHTLPLIKLGREILLLDVNLGLFSANGQLVFKVLKDAYDLFPCSHYTIYKTDKK